MVTKSRRLGAVPLAMALLLAFFLLGLLVGWQGDLQHRGAGALRSAEEFVVFWEAWDRLERDFWAPAQLNSRKMTSGAVQGMVSSLGDPYSVFLEPAQHQLDSDRLEGEYEGVGVELRSEHGYVVVGLVHPGSPAQAAGLAVGDRVISVDNTGVTGLSAAEVQLLIRGPAGTMVELELQRDLGTVTTLAIERRHIEVPSVAWALADAGIGYVRIYFFSDRTPLELAEVLNHLADSNVQALVLDLRGNGGGVVEAAVGVLSQLLGKGIAYRELERGARETRHPVPFNPESVDWPLAVLVDAGTASSAEIVAAAFRDHKRGLLYGQATFGKGAVQAVFPLDDGSSVHLTVARWLSSDGRAIEGLGLVPDVTIDMDSESDQGEDLVLHAALNDLRAGLAAPTTSTIQ